jgi:hypothetical protein
MSRPEEVSMRPKMMIALGHDVERDRQHERRQLERRSLARVGRSEGSSGSAAASAFARQLVAAFSLRPGLS